MVADQEKEEEFNLFVPFYSLGDSYGN